MKSLDLIAAEKAEAEKKLQERKAQGEEFQKTLDIAAKGEHLPEDFEPVETPDNRMFSQDEVNKIVRDRLAKEKAKYGEAAAAMAEKLAGYESDIAKREEKLVAAELRFQIIRTLYEQGFDTDEATIQLVTGTSIEDSMKKIEELSLLTQNRKPRPKGDPDILREVMGLHNF